MAVFKMVSVEKFLIVSYRVEPRFVCAYRIRAQEKYGEPRILGDGSRGVSPARAKSPHPTNRGAGKGTRGKRPVPQKTPRVGELFGNAHLRLS